MQPGLGWFCMEWGGGGGRFAASGGGGNWGLLDWVLGGSEKVEVGHGCKEEGVDFLLGSFLDFSLHGYGMPLDLIRFPEVAGFLYFYFCCFIGLICKISFEIKVPALEEVKVQGSIGF